MKHIISKRKISSLGAKREQMMMAITTAKCNTTPSKERSKE